MASVAECLTAIANSIRTKMGTTDKMKIEEMPTLIDTIQSGGGQLQSKTVSPTKEQIKVIPDSEYYGLSDVTVEAIPDEFQDVSSVSATPEAVLINKAYVDMDGLHVGTMPNNGDVSAEIDGVNNTSVTIPEGYTSGGTVTYMGSGGGSGVNPEWTDWQYFSCDNNRNEVVAKLKYNDTVNGTTFSHMFSGCSSLEEIPSFNTSQGVKFYGTFEDCSNLKESPLIDTSNGKNFNEMYKGCTSLETIPELNFSSYSGSLVQAQNVFSGCANLKNIRFQNKQGVTDRCLPVKGNLVLFSDCPHLTKDSLMSIIDAMTNIGTSTYTVTIGSENLTRLQEEAPEYITKATRKNIALA